MLYAGLDLSRKRLDFYLLDGDGEGLRRGPRHRMPTGSGSGRACCSAERRVVAAIESMNGARFVHDSLERCGLAGRDRRRPEGQGPGAAWPARPTASTPGCWPSSAAATWCRRSGCRPPSMRAERERARWRLYLVRQRTSLKHRIHAQLLAFGHACPVSDLFGARGRRAARSARVPRAVARRTLAGGLRLIDDLEREIAGDRARAARARRRPPLRAAADERPRGSPGCSATRSPPRSATSTASPSPAKLAGYTGLCPRVYQSGDSDRRGPLTQAGPKYLRWALIEAATHACRHPLYRDALPAHQDPPRAPARPQGRPGRPRPPPGRGDLAHAHPQPSPLLRQAPRRLWPHDGPRLRCATGASAPIQPGPPRGRDREMSRTPTPA